MALATPLHSIHTVTVSMPQSVAIVHDWLTSMRGGERVVEALYRVFPQADLFTLTWDRAQLSPALAGRRPTTSAIHCIANAPFVNGRFRGLLPFFPLAVESFKLDPYSLVVCSSHCVAMGAIAPPKALHVAYVHSTLRYVREAQPAYEASVPGGTLGRAVFRGAAHYLRGWEAEAAARPHLLIANSTYTRRRISRYFQRDALVIEPPIDTDRFARAVISSPTPNNDAPFLLVSALVPYKRVDLALRAFQGRPERLVVVGDGPERARLERLVGPNTTLMPRVDDAELATLFARCRALLHTGIDDFGMVMVEALAAGKPVLACAEGGALDIVRDGETGLLIEQPTVESVRGALDRFASRDAGFDPEFLKDFARRFDRANFERRFNEAVEDAQRRRRDSNGHTHGSNGAGKTSMVVPHQPLADRAAVGELAATDEERALQRCVDDHSQSALVVKRFADVALAAIGLAATAPLIATLAGLIRLESRGPILFLQQRTGLHQRPFTLVKLRTMDDKRRVTGVGRWLRPLGLDELPQLWNVLRGEMSLVGPRPEIPDRVQRLEGTLPAYQARHFLRPGVTGWAQVNGLRGDKASMSERLRCDLEYVRHWSLGFDVRILLRTGFSVLRDTARERRERERRE
jgi:lipopolysaccharide/colanic/teichoic acid biosynthesis glycosyltransferase/glycosyltransferase involved in cell wall biosynthesis